MHAMSVFLNMCSGMNKVLIDDGARWILQGDEQERENRAAGVKALYSMLAATTSGRAKELVKQVLSERNGRRSSQTCFSSSGHPLTALRTSG